MSDKKKRITPREKVVEKFGSKEALAKKVASKIERPEGVTEAYFLRRLKRQKNSKLLRLEAIAEAVEKEFGGKEKLIDKICENLGHSKDKDFRNKLATFNLPKLYDLRRKNKAF